MPVTTDSVVVFLWW